MSQTKKTQIGMTVNGVAVEGLVEPRTLLVHFLRENLQLTGTHIGCETTHCGACTVDLDGMSSPTATRPATPRCSAARWRRSAGAAAASSG